MGVLWVDQMRRIGSYLTRDEVNAMLTPEDATGLSRGSSFKGSAGGLGSSSLAHKGSSHRGLTAGGKHHHHAASALGIQKIMEVDDEKEAPDSPAAVPHHSGAKSKPHHHGGKGKPQVRRAAAAGGGGAGGQG